MSEERVQYDVQAAEGRLRALAGEATGGPWGEEAVYSLLKFVEGNAFDVEAMGYIWNRKTDAAYIAACDPQTVLAILDALAAEREARQAAERERDEAKAQRQRWHEKWLGDQEKLLVLESECYDLRRDVRDMREVILPGQQQGVLYVCTVEERDTLAADNERLRAALERLEWVGSFGYEACPMCRYVKEAGHRDGCVLAAALAAPPSPAVAQVQRLREVEAAAKALFNGRNMAELPNAPHCYVVDGEALDAVKAALGAGEVA